MTQKGVDKVELYDRLKKKEKALSNAKRYLKMSSNTDSKVTWLCKIVSLQDQIKDIERLLR